MLNFEYLELPSLPPALLAEIHKSIDLNPNLFPGNDPGYTIHNGTMPLYEFLRPFFDDSYQIQVQQFLGGHLVPIHKDYRRNITCNYIIELGGPKVFTHWYELNIDNNYDLIESHKIEPFRWHRIRVQTPHNISGTVTGQNRISLCAFQPK